LNIKKHANVYCALAALGYSWCEHRALTFADAIWDENAYVLRMTF